MNCAARKLASRLVLMFAALVPVPGEGADWQPVPKTMLQYDQSSIVEIEGYRAGWTKTAPTEDRLVNLGFEDGKARMASVIIIQWHAWCYFKQIRQHQMILRRKDGSLSYQYEDVLERFSFKSPEPDTAEELVMLALCKAKASR